MLGPEFNSWPFKLHVIVMGISPWETTQVNWAKAPESITLDPKEKGTILGGSKTQDQFKQVKNISAPPVLTYVYH